MTPPRQVRSVIKSRVMPRWLTPLRFALALAVCLAAHGSAQAQETSSQCPAGNLLAGLRPVGAQDLRRDLGLLTDDQVGPEGAIWDAPLAVLFETPAATVTYDFGRSVPLMALHVQADANDTYTVWGSDDGQSFRVLGRVEPAAEGVHGLRSRQLGLGGVATRFLRLGEGVGDNFYSVSEIQAFCQLPTPFPPKPKVIKAPKAEAAKNFYSYWNDLSSRKWEFVLAVLGCWLLYWWHQKEREGTAKEAKRLFDRLLAIAGLVAALTYVNFGFFHFGNFIHGWDTFHYYVGSKYFRELSYDRLYECVAVADAEDPKLRRRVELRKITNLRTNALETTEEILKHPERCKEHFTAERWDSFKRDLNWFRNRESPKRWDDTSTDHGYNATPVWNIAGSLLANTGQASDTQIFVLNLIDPAYYLAMIGILWWAFGWRTLSVGLLAFATFFPSRFYWTGGAYLRWDWLFYTVASVALLKKDRPLLAGFALGYATLLRVFPGFVGVGPVLAASIMVVRTVRARMKPAVAPAEGADASSSPPPPAPVGFMPALREALLASALRPYLRYFLGAALAVAVLVPVSIVVAGGSGAYKAFVQNTVKHKETPLTNYMGLRTVTAYRPSEAGRFLRTDKLTDPWKRWKDARLAGYKQARPLHYAIVLGFLVLIGLAVYRFPTPWMAAAFGSMFIAVGVELTCYYYAFIIIPAMLWEKRRDVGWALLALTALSEIVSFGNEIGLKWLPGWLDEQYTLISAATLVAFGLVLWWFGPWGDEKPVEATAAPSAAPSAPSERKGPRRRTASTAGRSRVK